MQRRNAAFFEAAANNRLSIPPRRELPFPKPREIKPRSTSVLMVSPLSKSGPISRPKSATFGTEDKAIGQTKEQGPVAVVKATRKRVAQRKSAAIKPSEVADPPPPEGKNKTDPINSVLLPQDELSPLAAKSFAAASRPPSAASGFQSKATGPKKRALPAPSLSVAKRLKMVDQFTQTETIPSHDLKAAQSVETRGSITDIVHQSQIGALAPVSPPESYFGAIDTFISKHKTLASPKEIWEEPGWAEADEEERQLILNNFICENLANKDFLQLCEDMMSSWRLMGLGK